MQEAQVQLSQLEQTLVVVASVDGGETVASQADVWVP